MSSDSRFPERFDQMELTGSASDHALPSGTGTCCYGAAKVVTRRELRVKASKQTAGMGASSRLSGAPNQRGYARPFHG